LHREIYLFASWVEEMEERGEAMSQWAISMVERAAQAGMFPSHQVHAVTFGSRKTGLALPESDVDLVLVVNPVVDPQLCTESLARWLAREEWTSGVQAVTTTAIPVVKLTVSAGYSNIAMDVSIAAGNHDGDQTVQKVRSLLQQHPLLRPVVLVMKRLLRAYGLNDAFSGGVSSHALLLLAAAYFQTVALEHEMDLGEHLVACLHHWGAVFQPASDVVALEGTEPSPELSRGGPSSQGRSVPVVICDPVRPENNVGRTAFRFAQVQELFRWASSELRERGSLECLVPTGGHHHAVAAVAAGASGSPGVPPACGEDHLDPEALPTELQATQELLKEETERRLAAEAQVAQLRHELRRVTKKAHTAEVASKWATMQLLRLRELGVIPRVSTQRARPWDDSVLDKLGAIEEERHRHHTTQPGPSSQPPTAAKAGAVGRSTSARPRPKSRRGPRRGGYDSDGGGGGARPRGAGNSRGLGGAGSGKAKQQGALSHEELMRSIHFSL